MGEGESHYTANPGEIRQPGFWIPAYAGMTVGASMVMGAARLAVGGVSPSPNPLPMGEG